MTKTPQQAQEITVECLNEAMTEYLAKARITVLELFHAMYSRLDAAFVDWKVVNLLAESAESAESKESAALPHPLLKLGVWFRSTFARTNND
jgi:hypothetical protein